MGQILVANKGKRRNNFSIQHNVYFAQRCLRQRRVCFLRVQAAVSGRNVLQLVVKVGDNFRPRYSRSEQPLFFVNGFGPYLCSALSSDEVHDRTGVFHSGNDPAVHNRLFNSVLCACFRLWCDGEGNGC
jgi:hypothetical protein